MSIIVTNPNFDPRNFDPDTNITPLDNYNGVIKNSPFEANFSIDPTTGKITNVATISRYNKVTIGQFPFPGSSTVSVTKEQKVSIEKGKQGAGNQVKDTGIDLGKITITTDLFNDNDLDAFQDILNFYEGRKGSKAAPSNGFQIINPTTTSRGIVAVYLEGIEGPDYNAGRTTYKTRWVEVKPVKKTVSRSIKPPKQNGAILEDQKVRGTASTTPSKDPNNTQPAGSNKTKRTPG